MIKCLHGHCCCRDCSKLDREIRETNGCWWLLPLALRRQRPRTTWLIGSSAIANSVGAASSSSIPDADGDGHACGGSWSAVAPAARAQHAARAKAVKQLLLDGACVLALGE